MNLLDIVGLINELVTILALLIGGALAIFVFVRFAPSLDLRILPSWSAEMPEWVTLRIEVENKSGIRVFKEGIYLQVLQHKTPEAGVLSEWVPFKKEAIIPSEQPAHWGEPVELFQTTKGLDAGDVLIGERLYHCPPDTILHVGLQVTVKLGFLGRIGAQIRGGQQRWTTTRIVMR